MKDFVLGVCIGVLLMLFLLWLFDRRPPTPPREAAQQPVPKYAGNVTDLESEQKIS